MKYTKDELERFRQNSIFNKSKLLKSKKAGCFCCFKVFDVDEIDGWYDGKPDYTAVCPNCCMDTVIPESDEYVLDEEFLKAVDDGGYSEDDAASTEDTTQISNSFEELYNEYIKAKKS